MGQHLQFRARAVSLEAASADSLSGDGELRPAAASNGSGIRSATGGAGAAHGSVSPPQEEAAAAAPRTHRLGTPSPVPIRDGGYADAAGALRRSASAGDFSGAEAPDGVAGPEDGRHS